MPPPSAQNGRSGKQISVGFRDLFRKPRVDIQETHPSGGLIRRMESPAYTSPSRIPKPRVSFFNGVRGIEISGGEFMAASRDYI